MIWPLSRLRSGPVATVALAAVLVITGCSRVSDLAGGDDDQSAGTFLDGVTSATPVGTDAVPITPPTTLAPTTIVIPLDPTFDAIAARTTMTVEARNLLAGTNPVLVDRTGLGSVCPLDIDLSVLGCYASGRIAVLQVTDTRLDGMNEATTAHEMLHVAWSGLDEAERQRLIPLLQAAYARAATPELTERIEAYRAGDPTVVDNELHSIIGTEVADVGPELEAYYQRWFTDRAAVVALASTSRTTFTSLEAQVDDLDVQLNDLRARITTDETTLDTSRNALEAQLAGLEALKAEGRIDEYNAGVEPFNQQVAAYNDAVAAHRIVVDQHNELVRQRNDLAAAYSDLVAQIDTTVESLPS